MDSSVIAKVQSLGFNVWMRKSTDTWMIFATKDDKQLGYMQEERLGGPLSISTVHIPSTSHGTGFSIDQWVSDFTKADLERCFVLAPAWDGSHAWGSVKKWRDLEQFRNASKFNQGYGLVPYQEIQE